MKILIFIIAVFLMSCSTSNYSKDNEAKYLLVDSTIFQNEILKFKLSDGDTLVDIGSGYGVNDQIIFKFYPGMYFILEDINKKYIYKNNYFIYVNGRKEYFKDHFVQILGTPDSIPLGSGLYKNILCRITLHEFTNPTKMLSEIKRIMTPEGKLIIVEQIPKYKGEIEKSCKKKLLNKEEIIQLLLSNKFKLASQDSTRYTNNDFDGNAYILSFTK